MGLRTNRLVATLVLRAASLSRGRYPSRAPGGAAPRALSRGSSRRPGRGAFPHLGSAAPRPGPRGRTWARRRRQRGRHLAHRRVGYPPGPYPLDLFLRKVARAHASNVCVRVGFASPRVPDGLKEVPDPPGEVLALRRSNRHPVSGRVLEPKCGREAHGPGYRQHLLVAGVLYAPLA